MKSSQILNYLKYRDHLKHQNHFNHQISSKQQFQEIYNTQSINPHMANQNPTRKQQNNHQKQWLSNPKDMFDVSLHQIVNQDHRGLASLISVWLEMNRMRRESKLLSASEWVLMKWMCGSDTDWMEKIGSVCAAL